MNLPRRARIALGASLTAAALTISPALPADAAAIPGWRIIFSHHYGTPTTFSSFWSVSAASTQNAWAVGGLTANGAPGSGSPIAVRWQGGKWQASPLPGGLTSYLFAVSADSGKDAWAISGQGGYVLHWNGTGWSVAKRWPEGGLIQQLTGVTAFSPTNVWVFGGSGAYPGEGTWHLTGTTWTKVTGNGGNIDDASALSATNMWAIGGMSAGEDAIMHYTGGKWLHETGKALTGLQFLGIVALSGSNVWASGFLQAKPTTAYLLHRTSSGWVRVKLPWPVSPGRLASDGHGGVWLTADGSGTTWEIHRLASGLWSRTSIPHAAIYAETLIPGTTSVWGAGAIGQQTGSEAAIWAYGPVG